MRIDFEWNRSAELLNLQNRWIPWKESLSSGEFEYQMMDQEIDRLLKRFTRSRLWEFFHQINIHWNSCTGPEISILSPDNVPVCCETSLSHPPGTSSRASAAVAQTQSLHTNRSVGVSFATWKWENRNDLLVQLVVWNAMRPRSAIEPTVSAVKFNFAGDVRRQVVYLRFSKKSNRF